jgi:hypothetical protein
MTRSFAGVPLLLLLGACTWLGGRSIQLEPVDDVGILAFAERAGSFYALLENAPLDALVTFEDEDLRAYFAEDGEFTDYYATLANRVRKAQFRHSKANQVVIQEFRLEGNHTAFVDIVLVGRHQRYLIFWDLEVQLTDVWRQRSGAWFISPGKL